MKERLEYNSFFLRICFIPPFPVYQTRIPVTLSFKIMYSFPQSSFLSFSHSTVSFLSFSFYISAHLPFSGFFSVSSFSNLFLFVSAKSHCQWICYRQITWDYAKEIFSLCPFFWSLLLYPSFVQFTSSLTRLAHPRHLQCAVIGPLRNCPFSFQFQHISLYLSGNVSKLIFNSFARIWGYVNCLI